jgi:hypothetical protein
MAAREQFLDLVVHGLREDGSRQQFRISGEPKFDRLCRLIGYRCVATEVLIDSATA